MRNVLMAFVVLALAGCGGTYNTQCDGPGGIDCSLLDLPICTSQYGAKAPHAICTRPCEQDEDCGPDGACTVWRFPLGEHRVCMAPNWTDQQLGTR